MLREEGREPELVSAAPGRETLEALRKVLHRLFVEEGLAPWQIAVLTGRSLAKSDVWRQRVFGNQVLWNGSYDEAGHSLGLSADRAPDQPTDTILYAHANVHSAVHARTDSQPSNQRIRVSRSKPQSL